MRFSGLASGLMAEAGAARDVRDGVVATHGYRGAGHDVY